MSISYENIANELRDERLEIEESAVLTFFTNRRAPKKIHAETGISYENIANELRDERLEIEESAVLTFPNDTFQTAYMDLQFFRNFDIISRLLHISEELVKYFELNPYPGKVMTNEVKTAYKLIKRYQKKR